MPINWGSMTPIAPPQVVAQLPQQANQTDSLANGIMSGILQGQQMQSNNMTLQKQRQEMTDQEALRNAPNEDAWLKTLQQQGKHSEALQYKNYQIQYQNNLLQNKANILELNEKERKKADRDNAINVAVMGQVSQLPPEQQQSTYTQYRQDMLQKYPDLVMPEEFNANSFASVMRTNEIMQKTQEQEATEKVNTLTQLETRLDNLLSQKQQYIKEGKPTNRIDEQITNTQNLISTHTKNVQTQKTDSYETELGKELGKQDAQSAKESGDTRTQVGKFRIFNDKAREQLPNVPGYAVGPIASSIKLDKLNPQAQILNSYLAATTAFAKDLIGLKGGAQGMTEKEWEMVKSIAGGTFQNKYTLKEVMTTMDKASRIIEYREWKNESDIRKGHKTYDRWLEANPEPPNPEKEKSSPEQAQFQDGQIYQDAKGNKAKYVNGKWEMI
jgi:hypothetical protein